MEEKQIANQPNNIELLSSEDTNIAITHTAENGITSSVNYTIGWLGKKRPGIMKFDGVSITLQDIKGTTIFSSSIEAIKNVKRIEFGIYFYIEGKKMIFVSFGNELDYVSKGAALGGGVGVLIDTQVSNIMNEQSGMEDWVRLLEKYNKINLNASPNNLQKWGLLMGVGFVGIFFAIGFLLFMIGFIQRQL